MKKLFFATTLLTAATSSLHASKLSAEEHVKLAMVQVQATTEKGGPSFATVGNDVSCDFRLGTTRIQEAIDSGVDEVRIADDTYVENLTIDDISIVIRGGYDNCADAANNISNGNRQTIDGSGNVAPTVLIIGNTQRNTVTLESLTLTGGEGSGFSPGGGVSAVAADVELNLLQVNLSNNTSNLGGGLAVFAGNTDVILSNPFIVNNSATEGGGIYCDGIDASILVFDTGDTGSSILLNQATDGDGGGARVTNGCAFTSLSGRAPGGIDFRGMINNSATGHGGAIAASNGARINLFGSVVCGIGICFGSNETSVNLSNNNADSDNDQIGFGGGIYATGADTIISLTNPLITANTAQSGGGIAIEDQAELSIISEYFAGTCWNPGSCSQLTNNSQTQLALLFAVEGFTPPQVRQPIFQTP